MPKPTFYNLPESKRERFVDAAVFEFARYSFGEASLSRIVRNTGIAKGSVYQYFIDKLDLYHWLVVEEADRRKHAFRAPPLPSATLFESLHESCVAMMVFFRAEPQLGRLALRRYERESDLTLSSLFSEARARDRRDWVLALEVARARGQVRVGVDLEHAAFAFTHVAGPAAIDAYLTAARTDLAGGFWGERTASDAEVVRIATSLVGALRDGLSPSETRHSRS